jgi:hypothetical protein
MTDGETLIIFHPDQIIPSRGTAIIGRRATPDAVNERDITISLLHVVRLEPIEVIG